MKFKSLLSLFLIYGHFFDFKEKSSGGFLPKNLLVLIFSILILNNIKCKKFVEVGPPITQITSSTVYTNDETAQSAILGIYSKMINGSNGPFSGGNFSISVLSGLSSDELVNYSTSIDQIGFYTNSLVPTNSIVLGNLWTPIYEYIYYANSVIEGLDNSSGISPSMKLQLMGEAQFIRAFCNFYLVNLFGEVPLITMTNYSTNNAAFRAPISDIYNQIETDLKSAIALLPIDYSVYNEERVRPNKWAACALLARVYLYTDDWKNAEIQTDSVINNTSLYNLDSLNYVFLKNSSETIWQLEPNAPGENTWEGSTFILAGVPHSVSMSNQIISAFEPNDNRMSAWVGNVTVNGNTYYYPYKYKVQSGSPVSEYSMILRLGEQYLIRAEARTQLNELNGASEDLNIIRARAGLGSSPAVTQADLLTAIIHERQVELFTEWGHRWLDTKRSNLADSIFSPLKSPDWKSTAVLYPIPESEILVDPNLTQNAGY
jgi:starch-binding outer membrane protein, SusD/RagB family